MVEPLVEHLQLLNGDLLSSLVFSFVLCSFLSAELQTKTVKVNRAHFYIACIVLFVFDKNEFFLIAQTSIQNLFN